MEYQTIKGEKVPSLGLGTYRLTGEACVRAVERGLSVGYRHLDTAQMYGNEAEVGRGIENSGVDRGEIFVTTKVWPSDFARDRVIRKTRESLKKLGTGYVDLLLMHWPGDGVPLGETLGAMRELQQEGGVLHIGVSNFSPSLVEEATEHAEIFCNQVQYHPYKHQDALRDQAQKLDYLLTAYTPLSRGGVGDDATLKEIGEAHGKKTATQVALRWLLQQDKVSAIPKATGEGHLAENLDVFDFGLSEEEMDRIFSLGR
jgi:diketogulonate reductase-like aldo/keto reductase